MRCEVGTKGRPCVAALIFSGTGTMSRVTHITKALKRKQQKADAAVRHDGFQPCSPDMTICGDCEGNRAKNACPRLKEWLAKQRL